MLSLSVTMVLASMELGCVTEKKTVMMAVMSQRRTVSVHLRQCLAKMVYCVRLMSLFAMASNSV